VRFDVGLVDSFERSPTGHLELGRTLRVTLLSPRRATALEATSLPVCVGGDFLAGLLVVSDCRAVIVFARYKGGRSDESAAIAFRIPRGGGACCVECSRAARGRRRSPFRPSLLSSWQARSASSTGIVGGARLLLTTGRSVGPRPRGGRRRFFSAQGGATDLCARLA
jgi:hypothetical protein